MANPNSSSPATAGGSSSTALGAVWKDRYRIEKELGRGGFGIVYLARDQQLHSKPVVLKVLLDETTPDPYFQKKFQQEIEALARIDHPGVVGVLDVGESPDHKPFLVMQYVEGVTLRSALTKDGMEFSRVAHILRQVGQALGAAHDKGIYHRDLKPENIMLTRSGETEEYVKLIDFGIAAVRDSQVAAQTQPSKVVGTLSYMAPEQVMGKGSPASDIYSLGVIAFEMLTGQRPEVSWEGVSKKPRDLRPAIPEAAQEIILHALSYQPEKRMMKPREFGDQMARALGSEPTITAPLPTVVARAAPAQSSSSAGLETGHVLFMDIVAYSKLSMDLQRQRIQQLAEIVRNTAEYKSAQQINQIISLPTGDGMALVFFQNNPVVPVQCAIEISRALKSHPEIKLRMGVNSGPVYRIADINTNSNVAGGGINMAQRVMDCGDAGHILLSKRVADDLEQLSDWAPTLHELGEAEVKHGVKVNIVNFYTSEVGNSDLPEKIRKSQALAVPAAPAPVPAVVPAATPATVVRPVSAPVTPPAAYPMPQPAPKSGKGLMVGGIGAVAAVLVVLIAMRLGTGNKSEPSDSGAPTSQSSMGPAGSSAASGSAEAGQMHAASPGAIPPAGAPPVNPPVSSAVSSPEPPAAQAAAGSPNATTAAGKTEPATIPGRPAATRVLRKLENEAQIAQGADTAAGQSSAQPAPAPALSAANRAELQKARERMIDLASRAEAIGSSLRKLEERQSGRGLGLRADMAAARTRMEYLMGETKAAIDAKDFDTANRNMDLVEPQIEKLEGFLGR